MTGAAIRIFNLFDKCQCQWLMSLMTCHTVFEFLTLGMRFVTVKAIWSVPMFFMTEGAGKTGVCRLVGVNFLHYGRMAGVAGRFLALTLKDNVQRLMRIGMATQAILQLKMRFIGVAV